MFDSPQMERLCSRYANRPETTWPLAVQLAASQETAGERNYIEALVAVAPENTGKKWQAGLTDADDEHHLPTWFEVMLFGWLNELGQVAVEPNVMGNEPDFALQVEGRELFVEAKTLPRERSERDFDKRLYEFMSVLEKIELPLMIKVQEFEPGRAIDSSDLLMKVEDWLKSSPERTYHYQDRFGSRALLGAQSIEGLESVGVVGPGRGFWANTEKLKHALKKKAGQHSALRQAKHPYLLAFFLEHWIVTAEQFVKAWFGEVEYLIHGKTLRVVDQRLKPSGIHFGPQEILYRSVSGTLVFQAEWAEALRRRELRAWYIENPYARVPVDPSIFPVKKRFVVVSSGDGGFRMEGQQQG